MGSVDHGHICCRWCDMGQSISTTGLRARAYSLAGWVNEAAIQTVAVAQVCLAAIAIVIVCGVLDRTPPATLISVEPAYARAGEIITIRAKIKRDLTRDCDAEFSRYIFGMTAGNFPQPVEARFVLGTQTASSDMIRMMDRTWPGGLIVSERVPFELLPGSARLIADITYRCNKGHSIWPVTVNMTLPFEVLP